jgi:hypothetical protein
MGARAAFHVCALAIPVAASAATPEEATALSERAAAYIVQVGEQRAVADFTRADGGFVEGQLYVFCYDHEGVNKAHGANPLFVGKNLLHIKDPDGHLTESRSTKLSSANWVTGGIALRSCALWPRWAMTSVWQLPPRAWKRANSSTRSSGSAALNSKAICSAGRLPATR